MKLDRVASIYRKMKTEGEPRIQFDFEYNSVMADAFFFIDGTPFILGLGVRGCGAYFEFEIRNGFTINSWINSDDYSRFIEAFKIGLSPQSKGEFSTISFFKHVNDTFPQDLNQRNVQAALPSTVARYHHNIDEPNKTYFIGFRDNNKAGTHVRNLDKTRKLMGELAYERCKRENLSSVWSSNPNDENAEKLRAAIG